MADSDGPSAERIETEVCAFVLDPRGFVRATMREGAEFGLSDAVACVDATFTIAGERRRPVLVDARGVRSQTREAREYFSSAEAAQKILAVALFVGSPVSRMIGNFFLGMGAQRVPTRLFTAEPPAIDWLLPMVP